MSRARTVRIHYHRPPDRTEVFRQELIVDRPEVKITVARSMRLEPPMTIEDRVVLESGSDVVWFTFPDTWHDIGRFHRADGTFTGLYANILTPVSFRDERDWSTTDLFLDIWCQPGGDPVVLDEQELEEAERKGWVDGATARSARQEVRWIREAAGREEWPPAVVKEWTRERAIRRLTP